MISTISKRAGRRYPSYGAMLRAMWLPSVGTTAAPPVIGATPDARRGTVPVDVRALFVVADDRTADIPPENRRAKVR
jgi:hypothetical protein